MSEIGIIGLMYEDRRTKKRGKLVERDDKYKTLLMESEDGKSFNISYGGFKSNWRSVDEPMETVEEVIEEVEIPKETEPVVEKKERKKQAERQVRPVFEESTLKALDYAKSFNDTKVNVGVAPAKRNITIKVDKRRIFILTYMVNKNTFQVCTWEKLLLLMKDKEYVKSPKYNETWRSMKYSFIIDSNMLDVFLEDVRQYIIDFMCNEIEEEE